VIGADPPRVLTAATAIAVSCVFLASCGGRSSRDDVRSGGPVQEVIGLDESVFVRPGRGFTDSSILLQNQSPREATVVGVKLFGSRGLGLREALGAGRGRGVGAYPVGTDWPPKDIPGAAIRPLRGMIVPARGAFRWKQGLQVLLRLRVPRHLGRYLYRGLLVDYRVGDVHYRLRVHHVLVLCITPKRHGQCQLPPA
jgi:hypothetical protein